MSVSVTMPQLGESVTEGTVTRWLKQVGDTVAADEPLLEVSTDKVDTEIPAPASGVLLAITARRGRRRPGRRRARRHRGGRGVGGSGSSARPGGTRARGGTPQPGCARCARCAGGARRRGTRPSAPRRAPAGDGTPVTLPALGESVTEGTVTRWLKAVGDSVAVDEPLVEVSTDKVDTEIPSPGRRHAARDHRRRGRGRRGRRAARRSSGRRRGTVRAGTRGAAAPAPTAAPARTGTARAGCPAAPRRLPRLPRPGARARAYDARARRAGPGRGPRCRRRGSEASDSYVTPLVRKLAADNGVDLATVTGTGVGGRIRKQDVLAAAEAAKAPAAAARGCQPRRRPRPPPSPVARCAGAPRR